MASINKMGNDYSNIGSISLSSGLDLGFGLIGISGNVDGLATGATTLVTVPTGQNFLITHLVFIPASFTGATGNLVLSVGTVGAGYDNIMPSTTLTNFNASGEVYIHAVNSTSVLAVPTDNVTVNITTAFSAGTFGLFEVALLGVII